MKYMICSANVKLDGYGAQRAWLLDSESGDSLLSFFTDKDPRHFEVYELGPQVHVTRQITVKLS